MKLPSILSKRRVGIRHLILISIVVIVFQLILSYRHSVTTRNLLAGTMDLYRQDSAERVADLTATSLELLTEQALRNPPVEESEIRQVIQEYNTILSLQALEQNVEDICVLVSARERIYSVDNGSDLYDIFFRDQLPPVEERGFREYPIQWYAEVAPGIIQAEQIISEMEGERSVHVLVPFVPKGNYNGVVYMKLTPDFSNIVEQLYDTFDESGALFTGLILIALLALFYLTSYVIEERDAVREQLFAEKENQIKLEVEHRKEALFTQRIYHAHHKAEKVMGFMKEDLRTLSDKNLDETRSKISKYANYISRVIYDMKSYDPPLHVIRNPAFETDMNEVIRFLAENLFSRVYRGGSAFQIKLELDDKVPAVPVNEYVVWEILEPLIQNSIDHNPENEVTIVIKSNNGKETNVSTIEIEDDGVGIEASLLELTEDGIRKIFAEHTTTKPTSGNSGYGCYLAHEYASRCGWQLEAMNLPQKGCRFTISIPYSS